LIPSGHGTVSENFESWKNTFDIITHLKDIFFAKKKSVYYIENPGKLGIFRGFHFYL